MTAPAATLRTQCAACPWRDLDAVRAEVPHVVEHAKAHPDDFTCHTRCGPCPGPRRAGLTPEGTP